VLYTFCSQTNCTDGNHPVALTLGPDGNFYGVTIRQGAVTNTCAKLAGCGTIFMITPEGVLTTLHSFTGADGGDPTNLVLGTDGNFYGETTARGTGQRGTFFKMTPTGVFTTVFAFSAKEPVGEGASALILGSDGNFYGADGLGDILKITPAGKATLIFQSCLTGEETCPTGLGPLGALVQGSDGNFYGTDGEGGPNLDGIIFKVTPAGKFTVLHTFLGGTDDGAGPAGSLVQGADGDFYGMTFGGGANNTGVIYKITSTGTFTILHSQAAVGQVGGSSDAGRGMTLATDGKLYGAGGSGVFSFDMGFSPFVQALRNFGNVGSTVTILGNSLTGTSAVSFDAVAALFKVVSDTEITATVSKGATTGKIEVTTPNGTLSSNIAFKVTPQVLSFAPSSGAVGSTVVITGQSLTGASAVSFGGVLATSFTVNSDTQITATVPTGAVTGDVAVRTAGGRAQSATAFTVTP
jgi:uncharacterized repeat protein (TIGR03803 family)